MGKWGLGWLGELVILEREGPVAVLTLNRTERHNSLVPEFLEEMLAALETAGTQPGVRAVVLQANGRSFSTGGDVRGFHEQMDDLEAYAGEIVGLLNSVILAMIALPVPIIGFSPDGGWTALLPAIIGLKRTGEVLMRNQTITAEQAVAWGLASRIVPSDRICEEALSTAQDLAAMKAGSIGHTKAILGPACSDLEARLEAERTRFVQQITTEEARQGIEAFLRQRQAPARDDRKGQ